MLSRNLRRTLLSSRSQLPPTFLLPWAAGLTTVSHNAASDLPPSIPTTPASQPSQVTGIKSQEKIKPTLKSIAKVKPFETRQSLPPTTPLQLSPSIRELLPLLRSQTPHYINIHIHGKPYLLTEGDTLRLPFIMHGVEPGDVLRLNRALHLGSRDFTLKAGAAAPPLRSATRSHGSLPGATVTSSSENAAATETSSATAAPHFIPHIALGKHAYVDERLYECRAVVMGTESEPMRIKEKTKRRQRHVKHVRSKHRFTILKIKELRVKSVEELELETQ